MVLDCEYWDICKRPRNRKACGLGYEGCPTYSRFNDEREPENCQSHLTQDTLDLLKLKIEHPSTPETLDYLIGLNHPLNPHEAHWLGTGLGQRWIEHQEELK